MTKQEFNHISEDYDSIVNEIEIMENKYVGKIIPKKVQNEIEYCIDTLDEYETTIEKKGNQKQYNQLRDIRDAVVGY